MQLFANCVRSHIILDVKWVPRELNTEADTISQILVYDDYTINDRVLYILWGPHTVGKFACCYNTKLARFNSRFYQPGAEVVDAFTQDWKHNNNWLFPSTVLIIGTIRHLRACLAEGTLIVPLWKSSACFGRYFAMMGFIGTITCDQVFFYMNVNRVLFT